MNIYSGITLFKRFNFIIIFILFSSVNSSETDGNSNSLTVKAIAVDPLDSDVVYAGTIAKGVFKSSKNGAGWNQIWPEQRCPPLRVLTIHPAGPDTVYAATVDGIFKSLNAGIDWICILDPSRDMNEFRAFAVNPRYPEILLAGGPFERWRSTDGGSTWQEIEISPIVGIGGFAIDPENPEKAYFVSGSAAFGFGIWKSTDLGKTWVSIHNNIDSVGFGEDIVIDPENSDILYFAVNAQDSETGRCLWKSTDGGNSWSDITPSGLSAPDILVIRVYPSNYNVVFACTGQDGVYKSIDGGNSWKSANSGIGGVRPAAMEIDPASGTIYLGTYRGGIFRSTDMGESWEAF